MAADLHKRIRFHTTRYRNAHDGMGRSWITVDDVEIMNMQHLSGSAASEDSERHASGVFTAYDLPMAMREFLNMGIDVALSSENPLIRALAVVDRRTGNRRLKLLNPEEEVFPVDALLRLRLESSNSGG